MPRFINTLRYFKELDSGEPRIKPAPVKTGVRGRYRNPEIIAPEPGSIEIRHRIYEIDHLARRGGKGLLS